VTDFKSRMMAIVKYFVLGTIAMVAGYFVRNAQGDPAKASEAILTAGGWLGLLVKVLADDFRAAQSLRLSQQSRLLTHASELNGEPYSGLIQKLLGGTSVADVPPSHKYELAGKLEEVFLEYEFGQIPYAEIHKRYGNVVIELSKEFKSVLNEERQRDWWAAYLRFSAKAEAYEKRNRPRQKGK
jgi:hypothetical protein